METERVDAEFDRRPRNEGNVSNLGLFSLYCSCSYIRRNWLYGGDVASSLQDGQKNPMDRYDRKLKQELVSAIGPRTVGETFMIIIFFLSFFSAPLSLRRGPHSQRHTHTRVHIFPLVWETHREREGEWIFIHLVAAILSLSLSPISLSIYSSCCCGFEYCQIMWKKRAQALNNKKKGGSQNNLSGSEIVFFLFLE